MDDGSLDLLQVTAGVFSPVFRFLQKIAHVVHVSPKQACAIPID